MWSRSIAWGVRAAGPAPDIYHPSDAQIAHFLARFVENVRSLSIDPVVVRANWLRAYDYVTDRGAQTLNEYARQADPFGKIGAKTATVEVISVVRASGDSFEVRWKESTYAVAELRLGENPQRIVRIIRIDARPVSSPFAGSSAAARGRSGVSTSAPF